MAKDDKNRTFFHAKASFRRKNNVITKIEDERGIWQSEDHQIEEVFSSYFHKIFSIDNLNLEDI